MKLFKNPKGGDKVNIIHDGVESVKRIYKVTPRSIKVKSDRIYSFNRDGTLNKSFGDLNILIIPWSDDNGTS